ncbi:MAG: GIY-YIG nuclease family protein [Thermodesulfovibrionia bacterium]|nr:GIY-YIG nuclease family protein [Thermodesulfovibrionia bacterium]
MFYIYILKSEVDGSFYTGQCQNIQERVLRHNNGYTKSTKAKRPWQMVYHESYKTRSEAIIREIQIKKMKSRKYINELIYNLPERQPQGD